MIPGLYPLKFVSRVWKDVRIGSNATSSIVNALQQDLYVDGFDERERTLIRFARHANRDPLRIPDEMIATVLEAGWNERQWVEALGIMELFIGFNKFLDLMQIDIDF